ncbi:MAG: hypothetical protein K8R21_01670, partial [Leptospira sp.]|nr:hypothetical protein [Leptospira sp.]
MRNAFLIPAFFCLTLFLNCGPSYDLSKFENLREPKISEKASLNVMTIELEGVAGEIASKGLGTLFKASYKLESSSRLVDKEAPRARWKLTDGKEFSEAEYTTKLIGKFGIAVSDSLKEIPDSIKSQNPEIKLETWNYGSVAEILHVGGYDKERPTV